MKRNILNKAVLLLALFLAFGCKTRKQAAPVITKGPQSIGTSSALSKSDVLRQISDKQINFNTLLIKAKADLTINNNSNDVSMNIRMQNEKAIWISLTAIAGIEVARALITPDSIKILNRIESSYTRKPFSYVYQFANKQVNFKTLLDLFVGNAISGSLNQSSILDINGGQAHLTGDMSGLAYLLIFNENYNLIQSNLNDKAASQTLTVNYSDPKSISGREFPHTVSIKSNASSKMINIDLKYNHVGLNEPVEFPFSVPKRFTVKD